MGSCCPWGTHTTTLSPRGQRELCQNFELAATVLSLSCSLFVYCFSPYFGVQSCLPKNINAARCRSRSPRLNPHKERAPGMHPRGSRSSHPKRRNSMTRSKKENSAVSSSNRNVLQQQKRRNLLPDRLGSRFEDLMTPFSLETMEKRSPL